MSESGKAGEALNLSSEEVEVFDFLDGLRASGVVNMWGAVPYIVEEYGVSKEEAGEFHTKWMHTFSQRRCEDLQVSRLARLRDLDGTPTMGG